jgi:hypothetical protein
MLQRRKKPVIVAWPDQEHILALTERVHVFNEGKLSIPLLCANPQQLVYKTLYSHSEESYRLYILQIKPALLPRQNSHYEKTVNIHFAYHL